MCYLYQKDEWALPGNLQNRKYSLSFLLPEYVVSLGTSPLLSFFRLSLSLSLSLQVIAV
jgi:hypothetical protein